MSRSGLDSIQFFPSPSVRTPAPEDLMVLFSTTILPLVPSLNPHTGAISILLLVMVMLGFHVILSKRSPFLKFGGNASTVSSQSLAVFSSIATTLQRGLPSYSRKVSEFITATSSPGAKGAKP